MLGTFIQKNIWALTQLQIKRKRKTMMVISSICRTATFLKRDLYYEIDFILANFPLTDSERENGFL